MIKMTTAWIGSTWKASERANAAKGMMPNWQRKPMKIPHGRRICAQSLCTSTVQPMENMTMASMTVSTMLRTVLRITLKLLSGTRQDVPEHTVALTLQVTGCADMMNPVLVVAEINKLKKNKNPDKNCKQGKK